MMITTQYCSDYEFTPKERHLQRSLANSAVDNYCVGSAKISQIYKCPTSIALFITFVYVHFFARLNFVNQD